MVKILLIGCVFGIKDMLPYIYSLLSRVFCGFPFGAIVLYSLIWSTIHFLMGLF